MSVDAEFSLAGALSAELSVCSFAFELGGILVSVSVGRWGAPFAPDAGNSVPVYPAAGDTEIFQTVFSDSLAACGIILAVAAGISDIGRILGRFIFLSFGRKAGTASETLLPASFCGTDAEVAAGLFVIKLSKLSSSISFTT